MKNPFHTLLAVALIGVCVGPAQAQPTAQTQPAIKLFVVDMAKVYDSDYRTAEKMTQLQSDEQKAQEEVDKMNKEGTALVDEYKSLNEQTSNPALTADAKAKAQNETQKVFDSIQKKQQEIQTFVQNSRNALNQRLATFRNMRLDEISKTASDIAKRKGATLLIDKSGLTNIGISNVIFSDPAYEITDEVMKEVNKDRPPATAAPMGAPTAAPSAGSPTITVPGITPKK